MRTDVRMRSSCTLLLSQNHLQVSRNKLHSLPIFHFLELTKDATKMFWELPSPLAFLVNRYTGCWQTDLVQMAQVPSVAQKRGYADFKTKVKPSTQKRKQFTIKTDQESQIQNMKIQGLRHQRTCKIFWP